MRLLAENRWPFRLHATYDESIARFLDVFEAVNRDVPLDGLHWFFDHAETISERSIDRIAAAVHLGQGRDGLGRPENAPRVGSNGASDRCGGSSRF